MRGEEKSCGDTKGKKKNKGNISYAEAEYRISVESGDMGWLIIIMLSILQWNARSLCANGQEFKGYINEMKSQM